jgi:Spy/CpxP family protein refolding chaperone
MKLRFFSTILAGTLLMGAMAWAQDQTPAPAPDANAPAVAPHGAGKWAGGALKLTPDQRKQIQAIRESTRDQAAIVMHDSTLTQDQKTEKLHALRAGTRDQIKGVLTPDQVQAFQQRQANRKSRVDAKLGLTDDQKTKLKATMQTARTQRQAVLGNTSLSYADKATQLKQIRENTKTQLSQILTPEQLQQMHRFRGRHGRGGMRGGPMMM